MLSGQVVVLLTTLALSCSSSVVSPSSASSFSVAAEKRATEDERATLREDNFDPLTLEEGCKAACRSTEGYREVEGLGCEVSNFILININELYICCRYFVSPFSRSRQTCCTRCCSDWRSKCRYFAWVPGSRGGCHVPQTTNIPGGDRLLSGNGTAGSSSR